jgi:uncharacterized protein
LAGQQRRPFVLKYLSAIASIGLATSATAASYDCARATSVDERTICANRGLNDRDVTMSVLYLLSRKMMAMGGRGSLIDQQNMWLTERRRCGSKRTCLTAKYDRRIAELRSFIDTRVIPRGPF